MALFRLETKRWYVVRVVFAVAGTLILASLGLAFLLHNPWWLALAALVGTMQLIFAFTGYCPAAIILASLGVPQK